MVVPSTLAVFAATTITVAALSCAPERLGPAMTDPGVPPTGRPTATTRPAAPTTVVSATTTGANRGIVLSAVADTTTTTTTRPTWPESVEGWRPYVAVWFTGGDVDRVLGLIECESFGDPYAQNPKLTRWGYAQGLLQHMSVLWPARAVDAAKAGYGNGGDIWNPLDQIPVSKFLIDKTPQAWDHWTCNR
jgi:hypothetical protein